MKREYLRLFKMDYALLWEMLFSYQQLKFISLKLTLVHEPQGKQTSLFRDERVITVVLRNNILKSHIRTIHSDLYTSVTHRSVGRGGSHV